MYSYKGSITFGFVYIPITLNVAVKENSISFNLLDKKTKSKIKYKKTCVDCKNKEVKNEDIIKGYEYDTDKYVLFTPEDFEKIKSKKDQNITIFQFVDIKEIDPIYYDKAYYVIPSGAKKAYSLLLQAMENENKVGLCKVVLGTKQVLAIIRTKNGEMIFNTLHFYDEIQLNPAKDINEDVSKQELEMAKSLIEGLTSKFNPKDYKDEYNEKLQLAIENKISGKEIVAISDKDDNNINDLLTALEESIKSLKSKKKRNIIPKNKEEVRPNV
ncbi:MAG: Ku protein [Anaeroplasma sp.]